MPASFNNVHPERRKTIRFRPAAPIVVRSLDAEGVLTLENLGSGGFSIQSSAALVVGAIMRFKFSTPDGAWGTLLTAQSVYCTLAPDAPPTQTAFITGFKFLNMDTPGVAASIHALIDRAAAVISFS